LGVARELAQAMELETRVEFRPGSAETVALEGMPSM
jgi:hypothetical protein